METDGTLAKQSHSVSERYSAAAQKSEEALCCPVSYAPEFLKVIPAEILEKDYGCGDPSPFVKPEETVVDLGSGGGKLCYIAAQIVGARGRVIGVDCNGDMLALARKYQSEMAEKLGFANTDFRFGRIQDLSLDLELLAERLKGSAIESPENWLAMQTVADDLRVEKPLIASDSVDCVVSNCVLNLVDPDARKQMFREIYRVLKVGGRIAISDIVSNQDVPVDLQRDSELWSGCISGAWREDRFLQEFVDAGFQGVQIAKLEQIPWRVVDGIEFRSMTVVAIKPGPGAGLEPDRAVIYRGPFQSVVDDDGNTFYRGHRTSVCQRTFQTLHSEPYLVHFIGFEPTEPLNVNSAGRIDSSPGQIPVPRVTKGASMTNTTANSNSCCSNGDCC